MRHGSLEYSRHGAWLQRPEGARLGFFSRAFGGFKTVGEEVGAFELWVDDGSGGACSDMEFALHSTVGRRGLLEGRAMVFRGRDHNPAGVEVSFRGRQCVVGDNGMLVMVDATSQVIPGDQERTLAFVYTTQRMIQGMIEGRTPGRVYVQQRDIHTLRGPVPFMVQFNRAA